MKNTMFVVAPGVIVEDLGSDSAVFVPGVSEVLTLSGDAAEVIRRVRSGESVEGAEAVLSDLVARGVIQPVGGMSRRGVVRAGVIGAGAGVAALAMPSVAAASSPVGGGSGGDNGGSTTRDFVTFELRSLGASLTESIVTEGRVSVKAVDANGVEVFGVDIPVSTPGTLAFKNGTSVGATAAAGNLFASDATTGLTNEEWTGGGHTLTFTFQGTEYVVEF